MWSTKKPRFGRTAAAKRKVEHRPRVESFYLAACHRSSPHPRSRAIVQSRKCTSRESPRNFQTSGLNMNDATYTKVAGASCCDTDAPRDSLARFTAETSGGDLRWQIRRLHRVCESPESRRKCEETKRKEKKRSAAHGASKVRLSSRATKHCTTWSTQCLRTGRSWTAVHWWDGDYSPTNW